MLLALLLCLPLGCDSGEINLPQQNPSLCFTIPLPDQWRYIGTYSLDTNGDGADERMILYSFDQPVAGAKQHGNPIAAFVYQPDDKKPPNFFVHHLRAPGDDYLCECECTPKMEDVLSGLGGHELVIHDKCDGERVRLTIFQWSQTQWAYLPLGHFHSHRIEVMTDTVTVEERQESRAQLAMRQVYYAAGGQTYLLDDQRTLAPPAKYEFVFSHEEPEDVTLSPYPEKIVLAFYQHYTDTANVSTYFADEAWDGLNQCDTGQCGCTTPRIGVAHVWVTSLEYFEDPTDPNHTTVEVTVVCEYSDGTPENGAFIRWRLVRAADRWQISSRE